jgi:hypothetical protein
MVEAFDVDEVDLAAAQDVGDVSSCLGTAVAVYLLCGSVVRCRSGVEDPDIGAQPAHHVRMR